MKSTETAPEKVMTWTTSQVVMATVFVVCVFLAFWLLYRLRTLILLLFIAIVLGTAIRPAVEWLRRRGISRVTGIIIIYVLIAALVVGFLAVTFGFKLFVIRNGSGGLLGFAGDLVNGALNFVVG